MAKNVNDEPGVAQERIHELLAARDEALSKRDMLLEEGTDIIDRRVELRRQANRALDSLIEEGLMPGEWVAVSEQECILIEPERYEWVLRRAPLEAVLCAPECSSAEEIESNAKSNAESNAESEAESEAKPLTMSTISNISNMSTMSRYRKAASTTGLTQGRRLILWDHGIHEAGLLPISALKSGQLHPNQPRRAPR